jgi:hypothetical protein
LWNGGLAHALALIDRHMDSLQRPDSPAGFLESGRGYLAGGGASGIGVEKRKPGWRVVFWGKRGDNLTIDNRCGGCKLPFMAKKKISSTDLIWIFHERLRAFDDHPLHGIPIAIVPVPSTGWTALTPRNVRLHRPLWKNRVRAIEQELRNNYVLKG